MFSEELLNKLPIKLTDIFKNDSEIAEQKELEEILIKISDIIRRLAGHEITRTDDERELLNLTDRRNYGVKRLLKSISNIKQYLEKILYTYRTNPTFINQ